MSAWPEISLAEFAEPISRGVEVIPGRAYRTIGVKWWGEGAYERETIDGSQTAARTLSVVREGDLIINKIWVRHGSTAVATAAVDGCTASSEFPTFRLDRGRVSPRWIHWLAKTRSFWSKCDALSQGSSGKNRIKPELFLTIRVPLPTLAEQERVVDRIEELAAPIHEARSLRKAADDLGGGLFENSIARRFEHLAKSSRRSRLGDLITRARNEIEIQPSVEYSGLGTRMWGLGVYIHETRLGASLEAERYHTGPGQLIYNEVWAHKGALGIVPDFGVRTVVSRHFHVFDVHWDGLLPAYLQRLFQSHWFWNQCRDGSVSSTGRGHLRREHFLAIEIPTPSVAEQRCIVAELDALQAEVDALKRLQAETVAELDALLPAILDRAFKGHL